MFRLFGVLLVISGFFSEDVKEFFNKFQQHDYKFELEWGEVIRYNKHDLKQFFAIVFKHNRTCAALNVTYNLNIDIGNDLEVLVQAYKFISNEYRVFPAFRFQINYCEALSYDVAGIAAQSFSKCGNFTGCPLLKNKVVHFCNWTPDGSRLPPYLPNGRYMLEIQAFHGPKEMFVTHTHFRIYRPFVTE